ncbi:MAG TPA: hypothetical protein VJ815_04105 [Acidimicrobiia bacterium]|nr:hypothetical protein [Acidimicrobiia bacterium]
MIPTAILLGLIGGLIPRYRWWSIPVIGVIWSIMLRIGGDPTMSLAQIWIVGFLLGAINGAVGVVFTWGLSRIIHGVFQLFRGRTVEH